MEGEIARSLKDVLHLDPEPLAHVAASIAAWLREGDRRASTKAIVAGGKILAARVEDGALMLDVVDRTGMHARSLRLSVVEQRTG